MCWEFCARWSTLAGRTGVGPWPPSSTKGVGPRSDKHGRESVQSMLCQMWLSPTAPRIFQVVSCTANRGRTHPFSA